MSGGRNYRVRQGDFGFALGIGKELSAGAAGPVSLVAVLRAGGCLGFRLGQTMAGGRNVCQHFCLCHCPIRLKDSGIGGFAVLRAGGCFGLGGGYRCHGRFGMIAVMFAGTGGGTGASVIAPGVNRIVPIMIDCANNPGILCNFRITVGIAEIFTAGSASPVSLVAVLRAGGGFGFRLGQFVSGGGNVRKHFCLCHCPIRLKDSGIGGFAVLRAGGCFGLGGGYRCHGRFGMIAVMFAGTGGGTGASVIAPGVNRIVPIMIDCANNPGILCNFRITVGIAEIFTAGSASPVSLVAVFRAGGGFGFRLGQAVGEEIPEFCTAEVALCLFGAGSRPTEMMVAVQGTVIGQGTALLSGHGAVVGQGFSFRHGEAGILSNGQVFTLGNLQIFLQGHIAVHGALVAVKDDTNTVISRGNFLEIL